MTLRDALLRRREMAAAATAGRWSVGTDYLGHGIFTKTVAIARVSMSGVDDQRQQVDHNMAHIAANDGTTVTALLDVVLASEAAGPWPKTTFVPYTREHRCEHCQQRTFDKPASALQHAESCRGIALRDALTRLDALIGSAASEDA